jgi:hypothetical protein
VKARAAKVRCEVGLRYASLGFVTLRYASLRMTAMREANLKFFPLYRSLQFKERRLSSHVHGVAKVGQADANQAKPLVRAEADTFPQ